MPIGQEHQFGRLPYIVVVIDELAESLSGDKLRAALRWVATGCVVRGLARVIDMLG